MDIGLVGSDGAVWGFSADIYAYPPGAIPGTVSLFPSRSLCLFATSS